MKTFLIMFCLVASSLWAADSLTIYEVDGATQTGRPITFGRIFLQGEIANFPQVLVGGSSVTTWQENVMNRWADGSVKFAVISFVAGTFSANGTLAITFQNSVAGSHTGQLTQAGMTAFNSGNWDGQIIVSPAGGGAAVTTSAKTILAASDPGANTYGDCQNNYWLKGPVVTAVILQDCTSTSVYDFGWTWNGSTMASPVTGNASTASFHPMFICYFYPSTNSVQIEEIMELPWSGRMQDQLADLNFKTENLVGTLISRWSRTGARVFTDFVVSGFTHNNPGNGVGNEPFNFYNGASATAAFVSTDVGSPLCVFIIPQWHCGNITTLVNSTNVTVRLASDDFTPFSGSSLTAQINTQVTSTRYRKVFWSGTTPGHIRIDYNFPYLISTKALVNYDQTIAVANPEHGYYGNTKCCGGWAYTDWATTDMGDLGGFNGWESAYANVGEGAPLQRHDVVYLYNMSADCGTPNGKCAKSWDMLTGEVDANASTTLVGVNGGGGDWFNLGNVPFHMRESRTVAGGGNQTAGNLFYCRTFENKNVAGNATTANCSGVGDGNVPDPTGPNNATGKALSRHAHSTDQFLNTATKPVAAVGTVMLQAGGWALNEAYYHWMDFAYLPYLLTGSPFYLEEEYLSASYELAGTNSTQNLPYTSNKIFAYSNPDGYCPRCLAWPLATTGHAAFIAPDGSAEASYYSSMVNSNVEVLEGVMGITGTTLTPASLNCSGASCAYNALAANRWDWGRATVMSQCVQTDNSSCTTIPIAFHSPVAGRCPVTANEGDVDPATTSAAGTPFGYSELTISTAHLRELGFPTAGVNDEMIRFYLERILDSTYNPYLIAIAFVGLKTGASSCVNSENTDPFITSYANLLLTTKSTTRVAATFNNTSFPDDTNFPCTDHGYSLLARASTSFAPQFNTSSSDANCPSGTCTAAAAWTWANAQVPYFNITPTTSTPCSTVDGTYTTNTDAQIKFALTPRAPSLLTGTQLAPVSRWTAGATIQ